MILLATVEPGVVAAIIVGCLSPLVTWLMAARRFSGKIQTTEASDLWRESAAIREWMERRVEVLNRRVAHLEEELTDCQEELASSNREIARLLREQSA